MTSFITWHFEAICDFGKGDL